MKAFYYILFYFTNFISVPYRFSKAHYCYRKIRETTARKLFNAIGIDAVIRPKLKISYLSKITLGNRSALGDRNTIVAAGGLQIGDDVMIGPDVMIFTQNHVITPIGRKLIDGEIEKKKL